LYLCLILILFSPFVEEIYIHIIFAFDEYGTPALEDVAFDQQGDTTFGGLDAALNSGGIHATGNVHRIAPDVVVEFGGADNSSRHVSAVVADANDQVEFEQILVEILQDALHLHGKLDQFEQVLVGVAVISADVGIQSGSGHERTADGFDFVHVLELRLTEQFVKIADQLVEDAQVFASAQVRLVVHFVEIDETGEEDAGLAVVLRVDRSRFHLFDHVARDDVVQQPVGLILQTLHFGFASGRHRVAMEAQTETDFEFPVQETDEQQEQEQVQDDLVTERQFGLFVVGLLIQSIYGIYGVAAVERRAVNDTGAQRRGHEQDQEEGCGRCQGVLHPAVELGEVAEMDETEEEEIPEDATRLAVLIHHQTAEVGHDGQNGQGHEQGAAHVPRIPARAPAVNDRETVLTHRILTTHVVQEDGASDEQNQRAPSEDHRPRPRELKVNETGERNQQEDHGRD